MTIVFGFVGCLLAAGVILMEFLAVRRLLDSTRRMEAVFGPLETWEGVRGVGDGRTSGNRRRCGFDR